ncbi:hypothetical protein FQN53_001943 [Emmonsiellopsis sp. PD_33]|nr:hypothetical protein FQN53_001943 [Emmonsiellopsis sp. PD_33]
MQFLSTLVMFLTATFFVAAEDTPSYQADLDKLKEQVKSLEQLLPSNMPTITSAGRAEYPAVFKKLDDPPESLIQILATAIPKTAFQSLVRAEGRSKLASEFQAGNTPAWYENLPSPVKSYFSHIKIQQTATDMPVNGKGTSTSSGLAAKPTGVVAGGLAVAAGVLGLAVAL